MYLHVPEEETDTRKGSLACLGHTAGKQQTQDSKQEAPAFNTILHSAPCGPNPTAVVCAIKEIPGMSGQDIGGPVWWPHM